MQGIFRISTENKIIQFTKNIKLITYTCANPANPATLLKPILHAAYSQAGFKLNPAQPCMSYVVPSPRTSAQLRKWLICSSSEFVSSGLAIT